MLLSIIIPVYNAADYLPRCLDTVFSQEMENSDYEVIAVNDGSQDNSLAILETYQRQYPNLSVITQENRGEALTRNRAIALAKGEYIAFVDSDDAVERNTFATLLDRAKSADLDILYLKMDLYDESNQFMESLPAVGVEGEIQSGLAHPRRTFPGTLYRSTLAKSVLFYKEIMIGPDTVFNAMVQSKAQRCSYCSLPHYRYTYRLNSLSKQGQSERSYQGFMFAIEKLYAYQQSEFPNPTALEKNYFENVIAIFVTRLFEHNIMPTLHRARYQALVQVLKEKQLLHLLVPIHYKFPYTHQNFWKMASYQRYLQLKSKLFHLVFLARKDIEKTLQKLSGI
jgi:glycosyltransferase involved in cell wall biosynthesis